MTEIYSKTKHPFYPIRIEHTPSDSHAEIIGWIIHQKPKGILTTPKPEALSFKGWIQVFCCILQIQFCIILVNAKKMQVRF